MTATVDQTYDLLRDEYINELYRAQRLCDDDRNWVAPAFGVIGDDDLDVKLEALRVLDPALAGVLDGPIGELRSSLAAAETAATEAARTASDSIAIANDFARWLTARYTTDRDLKNAFAHEVILLENALQSIVDAPPGRPLRPSAATVLAKVRDARLTQRIDSEETS